MSRFRRVYAGGEEYWVVMRGAGISLLGQASLADCARQRRASPTTTATIFSSSSLHQYVHVLHARLLPPPRAVRVPLRLQRTRSRAVVCSTRWRRRD